MKLIPDPPAAKTSPALPTPSTINQTRPFAGRGIFRVAGRVARRRWNAILPILTTCRPPAAAGVCHSDGAVGERSSVQVRVVLRSLSNLLDALGSPVIVITGCC